MKDCFFMFDQLKKSVQQATRSSDFSPEKTEVYFTLSHNERGGFVCPTTKKGVPITPDYRLYSGVTRELLKAIVAIQEREAGFVRWEGETAPLADDGSVSLAEHDYLLSLLSRTPNLQDAQGKPVVFAPEEDSPARATLHVEKSKGEKLSLQVAIGTVRDFSLITENLFLDTHNVLRPIKPLGPGFVHLGLFNTTIAQNHLERSLALFYSTFDHVSVIYEGWDVVDGEQLHTKPTLFFEKIDRENTLYLRISETLPSYDPDFFSTYDVSHVVMANELEQQLVRHEVVHTGVEDSFRSVKKLLDTCRKALNKTKGEGYFVEGDVFVLEPDIAQDFISRELSHLLGNYILYGAEKLKTYNITTKQPRLSLALNHGIDFLEGDASLDFGDDKKLSINDALTLYRKHSYIPLADGTKAVVNRDYLKRLERIFHKQEKKVRVSFFDLPLVEELLEEGLAGKTFPKARSIFEGFNELQHSKKSLPTTLKAKLRPYQRAGFIWLSYLYANGLGGCLADDMGLGKTLQAISLLLEVVPKESAPALIIMPKSLLYNWKLELDRFAPSLNYYLYYAQDRDIDTARKSDVILSTYDIVRNDIEVFRQESFSVIVLDESQQIKNAESQRAKAVLLLNAPHRFALSGTPLENNLGELYALFRFLNPAMFPSARDFSRLYAQPIQKEGNKAVMNELRKKIYPFILRRTKQQVLKDLPDKTEQVLYVEMEPAQAKLYAERRQFYAQAIQQQIAQEGIAKSQFFIFQAFNELRQLASIPEAFSNGAITSPKRELLAEYLIDAMGNRHKSLIFVNYLAALESIGEALSQAGIPYLTMSGATSNRQELVDQFQNDPAIKVFAMTIKTGGTGLNLTAADTVFIYDPWWNKAAENQAIDRAHRIGQSRKVLAYKLITKGTIEEKIQQLQEKKSALFDELISTDSASIKSFDSSDIDYLLG